ncbi:MAG: hypothetical protein IKC27_01780 [Kiritimatiellae bacterium]|nr:hypothetical protein [Kiritimatiellia bacterium]
MKNNVCFLMAVFAALFASAMPTKQELSKARSVAQELMAPVMNGYQEKTKTAVEVANAATEFAKMANDEAMKYLFLRGAVSYYIRSGDFGKAADAVEQLKSNIKGVPPSDIVEVISSALGRDNALKAPRLNSQLQLAQAQVRAAKDSRKLLSQLRQVKTDPVLRQYAETLALLGDWKGALAEFSKVSGEVGRLAKGDADGTAGKAELGDFWWDYKTSYTGGEPAFRERAANYYRKAIADGKLDGLKRTLVEQRLASLSHPDADMQVVDTKHQNDTKTNDRKSRDTEGRTSTRIVTGSSGIVHRWSFTNGFADSVGNIAPSKYGNAKAENGIVALQSGSPLEFPAGTIPLAPFTVQVWASATDKGLGAEDDFIFKIASASDSKDDSVFWTWRAKTKWVSMICAFGEGKSVGHGKLLVDGKIHLYTITGEKNGGGMLLKFYQDDTCFGERTSKSAWKNPPMLILGGFVSPTYDEVRVYSRALTHSEIITSVNEGADKVPEFGKGK